jgi:hypothetical protein
MKRSFALSGAAALLFVAAPAFAQSASGYVDGGYARFDTSTPFGDDDGDGWFIEGAVDLGIGNGAELQADVLHTDVEDVDSTTGTLHLFGRSDEGAVGLFVGAGRVETGPFDTDAWVAGLEGHRYYDYVTLTGALAYGKANDFDEKFAGANAGIRYFVDEDFRLDANLSWARADVAGFDSGNLWTFGVGGEYQFHQAPIAIFANYSHGELDDADTRVDAFRIGVRFTFGTGTLKERDRAGASFAPWGGFADAAALF